MSDYLPKRLRQLAKEMTEGDPKTASMLVLSAKELERLYVPESPWLSLLESQPEDIGHTWTRVLAATAEGNVGCEYAHNLRRLALRHDLRYWTHWRPMPAGPSGISNPTTKGETNGPA